jgi:hypothetical protein
MLKVERFPLHYAKGKVACGRCTAPVAVSSLRISSTVAAGQSSK